MVLFAGAGRCWASSRRSSSLMRANWRSRRSRGRDGERYLILGDLDEEYVDTNPAYQVRIAAAGSSIRDRVLTAGEIGAFWNGLDKEQCQSQK